jgi:hypothetical protein
MSPWSIFDVTWYVAPYWSIRKPLIPILWARPGICLASAAVFYFFQTIFLVSDPKV